MGGLVERSTIKSNQARYTMLLTLQSVSWTRFGAMKSVSSVAFPRAFLFSSREYIPRAELNFCNEAQR